MQNSNSRKTGGIGTGQIPVIRITTLTLPEAWEKAVLAIFGDGCYVATQWDKKDEQPSLDATLIVEVHCPFSEPRVHKNIPCGFEDLELYAHDLISGEFDWHVDAEYYTYTYSHRFRRHWGVDQIEKVVEEICKSPISRRNQIITWDPMIDPGTQEPPCLQRIWFRILEGDSGHFVLNMNTHWRSRDLWKAWFMNAFGMTALQKEIAIRVGRELNKTVVPGRYVDISDSAHIYGRDQNPQVIQTMRTSSFMMRSISTKSEQYQGSIKIAAEKLAMDKQKKEEFLAKMQEKKEALTPKKGKKENGGDKVRDKKDEKEDIKENEENTPKRIPR